MLVVVRPILNNTHIIAFGCVFFVACNIYYDVTGYGDVWFLGNNVAIFCYVLVNYRKIPGFITSVVLALASQQLIDEIFNDPTKSNAIEYIGAVILIIILYWRSKKIKVKNDS